ncbi:hypothetical protein D8M04_13140 [Oceanobacillus piezotolerans]|uniref:Uncharacterized protein n=1 Tax=Oceanobacillus piezotolerans TaxID=2448030 RepID=A0A498D7S9_9BACI|nr:hypothetical protein [Oceanobacillus piezotolerans]RLL43848.1 hypothetical protein D8M04_13140 [Oceanobacillus piezotolerans]
MGSHKHKKEKKRKYKVDQFTVEGCKIPYQLPCKDCKNHFRLNLAGLTENLNFQLLQEKDCKLEIMVGPNQDTEIGRIYNVGIDFIEIKNDDDKIITILKNKIVNIQREQSCQKSGAIK